jgi:hypothetical protein
MLLSEGDHLHGVLLMEPCLCHQGDGANRMLPGSHPMALYSPVFRLPDHIWKGVWKHTDE